MRDSERYDRLSSTCKNMTRVYFFTRTKPKISKPEPILSQSTSYSILSKLFSILNVEEKLVNRTQNENIHPSIRIEIRFI